VTIRSQPAAGETLLRYRGLNCFFTTDFGTWTEIQLDFNVKILGGQLEDAGEYKEFFATGEMEVLHDIIVGFVENMRDI
jgi:hypothetical protein